MVTLASLLPLHPHTLRRRLWLFVFVFMLFSGCAKENNAVSGSPPPADTAVTVAPAATPSPDIPPTPTATLPPPSPTPQLAALVNGQPILLETFNAELARYEMAQQELGLTPGTDGTDYRRLVLDALIEKELLRQSAQVSGVSVTPQMVDDRLGQLREAAEEHNGFDAWLVANKWTPEAFRDALGEEMMAETMIARITAEVPYTAEQVRARYIQIDDPALADSLLVQINEGVDFSSLAAAYSRDLITGPAGGDLGFFARGSLLVPEVEGAAFNLAVEEVSEVIAVTDSVTGQTVYYIVQVIERDPARPLSTALRYEMLQQTYDAWLADQLAAATIRVTLDE